MREIMPAHDQQLKILPSLEIVLIGGKTIMVKLHVIKGQNKHRNIKDAVLNLEDVQAQA